MRTNLADQLTTHSTAILASHQSESNRCDSHTCPSHLSGAQTPALYATQQRAGLPHVRLSVAQAPPRSPVRSAGPPTYHVNSTGPHVPQVLYATRSNEPGFPTPPLSQGPIRPESISPVRSTDPPCPLLSESVKPVNNTGPPRSPVHSTGPHNRLSVAQAPPRPPVRSTGPPTDLSQ